MRIEYSRTPLETILRHHLLLQIEFVYLNQKEFDAWSEEAEEKDILDTQSGGDWFTIKNCTIVFYLDHN